MNNKYELTIPEMNIFLVEKFNEGSNINTIPAHLKISENFDEEICKKIINKLIEYNDAMRIKIFESSEEIYQTISEYEYVDIKYIDKSKDSDIELYFENLIAKPLDFKNNQLFEFLIVRESKDSGYIFMRVHHIIADGWALGQYVNQLINFYKDEINETENEYKIGSYTEFIASEKEYIASEKYIKDQEFWKEYLKDYNNSTSLKNNTKILTTKAKRYSVKLDYELNTEIKEYVKKNRVSEYSLFMAAIATYIYRIKDQNDMVIVTPILNRSNFKEKNMGGMFISSMPVRIKIEENTTFLDVVKNIGKDSMSSFRHQKFPISEIIKNVHENSESKNKLYNIAFSYQNTRTIVSENKEFSSAWRFNRNIQDEIEINVLDLNNEGILQINYDYLTDLFSDVEIEYLHRRIIALLENAVSDELINIETIKIMDDCERNSILNEFNNTKKDYPKDKSIVELFEEQVKKNPNKVALKFEDKEMTYLELDEKSNQLANFLINKIKIESGDVISILLDKTFKFYISIFAILKSKAIYLPIDCDVQSEKLNYMITNSRSKLLISDKILDEYNTFNIGNFIFESESSILKTKLENMSEKGAYLMYTSGSTGMPKGALMSNRNVSKLVKNISYLNMDILDSIILAGNVAFDASMHEMWLCFLNGKTGYIVTKDMFLDVYKYKKIIDEAEKPLAIMTTQLFHQYVLMAPNIFSNLKYLIVGGDVMLSKYAEIFLNYNINTRLINIYGPTECTAASTTYELNSSNFKNIKIGRPIDNTQCYIVDKKSRLLPILVNGELMISGDGVGMKYINLNNNQKNNYINIKTEYLNSNAYMSGDICNYDFNGDLIFLGRKDNQIKIRGHRVELSEVENIILGYKNISEVCVLACKENDENCMKIYIVANNIINISDLKNYMAKKMNYYIIPKDIIQIDKMPLNSIGKIDKNKLKLIDFADLKESKKTNNNNLTELQKKLVVIFSTYLNDCKISINDDLIDIGLDSLKIAKSIIKANELNVIFSYKDVYESKTIKKLSKLIENKKMNFQNKILDSDKSDIICVKNKKIDLQPKNFKESNILLTGVTGFLGIHILENLISTTSSKIYCIIRGINGVSSASRLSDISKYYFNNDYAQYLNKRIFLIDMDLEKQKDLSILKDIINENNIHILINSAANVKHFGNKNDFFNLNITLVEKLISLATETNSKLIQISTLSVSGKNFEDELEYREINNIKFFDENCLKTIEENRNLYVYSKHIAETKIIDSIDKGLTASIIRIGNLTNSFSTGVIQKNYFDNGFIQRIKFIIDIGKISKSIYENVYFEFSPVDYVAYAVNLISLNENERTIYHVFNNSHISMKEIVEYLFLNYGIKIQVLDDSKFKMETDKFINEMNISKYKIILDDIDNLEKFRSFKNIKISNEISEKILRNYKFEWPEIKSEYLKKFFNSILNKGE